MALRLTGTALTEPAAADTIADGTVAREFSARASALLLAEDVAGYRALFGEAEPRSAGNSTARYAIWLRIAEQGLLAAGRARASLSAGIFTAIAAALIDALEVEPAEPVLLAYAGVALYELWSLDAARELFRAAQRLDPALPHVGRNLAELNRRKKAAARTSRPPRPELATLARRARHVASRARPAGGLTLSLCMIVRDEEEMLPRCLAAAAPAVDEIIIVDTGSTDRTIEIARSFGATVIEREWTGSFSDARNVSFDAATCDWMMYLDADEVLVADDVAKLRALTSRTWREAFYLVETNFTGDADDGTAVTHNALRVFRNRPEYRFEGRLHEQIAQKLPGYALERLELSSVRLEHYGYLGAVRDSKEKSRRNIDLLLAQQAESAPTPFLHYNLGSEYAAAGDAPAALSEFRRAWALVLQERDVVHEFAPSLMVRLVKALRCCGHAEEALEQAADGLQRFPGFTDLVFEQASACATLRRLPEARAHFQQCIEMGDSPARYTAMLGCGTYLPRIALAELHLNQGEPAPALALLEWCIDRHPGFFGVVMPYASALLRTGTAPDEVVARVERHVPKMTPTVRFNLGTSLYEAGAVAAADAQFRLVLAQQPHSASARVALAEALLAQRSYPEAAQTAAAVPQDDPLAATAVRSELFALILAGELTDAAATYERASGAGMPGGERALFGAWLRLLRGEGAIERLPNASTRLLQVMFEALLRVEEFGAFESLYPLLALTDLPRREQRELMATVYLRRGFLAQAAQEWMAVANQAPDPRALTGLARVALAHGLPADAAVFAREAIALDPGNPAALAVLDICEFPAAA